MPFNSYTGNQQAAPSIGNAGSSLGNNPFQNVAGGLGTVESGLGLVNNFTPTSAAITPGTSPEQLNTNYNQAQGALAQQQAFVNALQGQGGLGNQSSVFNQQQALANQLGLQAQGQGPNPALLQFQNATGQNVANQAALMGSQRGAGANPGLMARQIANQGAQTQQQAAGQAGVLQAQQQLAAQSALANQQANMANLANTQVNQYGQALGTYNQGAQNEQQMLLNANSQFNNAQLSNQQNLNNINAGVAAGNQSMQGQLIGGMMNGAGGMMSMFNKGGRVKHYDDGGEVSSQMADSTPSAGSTPNLIPAPIQSGKSSGGGGGGLMALAALANKGGRIGYAGGGQIDTYVPSYGDFRWGSGGGGSMESPSAGAVPNLIPAAIQMQKKGAQGSQKGSEESYGTSMYEPSEMGTDAGSAYNQMGGGNGSINMIPTMSKGGSVKKKLIPGDSPKNDIVPAMLSPGEIVIPRSKANDPDKAKAFIDHLMKSKSSKDEGGYGKVLEAHRNLESRIKELEKKFKGGRIK